MASRSSRRSRNHRLLFRLSMEFGGGSVSTEVVASSRAMAIINLKALMDQPIHTPFILSFIWIAVSVDTKIVLKRTSTHIPFDNTMAN